MSSASLHPASEDEGTASRTPRWIDLPGREVLMACLFLLFAVILNLYHLYPEAAIGAPLLNDGVLHRLAFERALAAVTAGQDPTDHWLAPVVLGYPLFHHYQHLPHLLSAALYFPFRAALAPFDLFNWIHYLLLSLFPLSIYWSMRRFGFARLPAALAGLVASLLATDGLYGFDLASYIWRGYGMYTQLWGMILLPPALAQGYTALKTAQGYFWAVLLLAATMMSHLVNGYIALVSMTLFVLLPLLGGRARVLALGSLWAGGRRLVLLLVLAALVAAYFLVPFLLDSAYMNRSVWEEPGKYDSYGYEWVLGVLVRGDLFDFGRLPSLTLLAGVGLLVCLWRWRDERYRVPVALPILWLLLYFGRPTWGVLLNLLPLSRDLHLHRLIAGVHLGGIMLMGLGLALPWRWAMSRRDARHLLAPAAITVLLLLPVYNERGAYLAQNTRWMVESRQALAVEEQEIAALVDTLRRAPPGRVYAGLGGNWGGEYKIGDVPMYALLTSAGLDSVGYLYHALSLNADVQVLFDEGRPEHYNLLNVRYVVAPADRSFPGFVQPVEDFGRHRLYQVATTGYFDLVGSDAAFVGDKRDFYPAASHWLGSDLPRVKQHPALFIEGAAGDYERRFALSQAPEVIPQASFPLEPPPGRVVSETVESNAYTAQIEAERESTLMLKATYHPNWHAIVDGTEAETIMLMPSYVGVKVGPGTHHVRLEYRPRPLRGYLLIAGLLSLPLIALAEWRREGLARWVGLLRLERVPSLMRRGALQIASWGPFLPARERLWAHLPYLGGLALLTLLAGLPLFQFQIMSGHDALAYLPRAVEFYEGLRAGQLFPRWAPDLSAGYGQPFFNFNPPLFYYVSALFRALGFSFVAAQNLACFVLLLLAGLGMYLLATEVFGSRGGLVSAVAYIFAPYLLVTLYVRHALADFSAFAFIPLAFWGLYRFARGGRYRFLLIGALAVALLLLSSNPVALITFPAFLILLGWLSFAGRSWHALLRGLWCLGLGVGLSALFWLPALTERDLVQTARLLEGYLNYQHHFVYLQQLIYSPWGYGLSLPGPVDGMSFALGPVHLSLVAATLLLIRRIYGAAGRAGSLVLFTLALLLLAAFFASDISMVFWERVPLLQFLEFPWRFLSLAAVGTAFACGFPFLLVRPGEGQPANGLMGVLIAGLFLLGFPHAKPETFLDVSDADYSPQAIVEHGIAVSTAREYEPIWVRQSPQAPAAELLTFLEGEGRVLSTTICPTYYEFQAAIMTEARLRSSTFYFPGWTLYVDGFERSLDYDNPQGVMEFSLEPGDHLVQLRFADTPVRLWGTRLSCLALFLMLLTPRALTTIFNRLRQH